MTFNFVILIETGGQNAMNVNAILEDSLERLAKKMNELMPTHPAELQPICNALTTMRSRGMNTEGFRRDLMNLAEAVIGVRKICGTSASFRDLPVPPYDLWLPFKAADLTPADAQDLSEAAQIFNHKVTAMAKSIECEPNPTENKQ